MTVARQEALSKDRGNQPIWVWIMVLMAHGRRCVYCDEKLSETLEHEDPLAGRSGRDIWWNLVPACDRCNGWKHKKSAVEWARDMKLHHAHPRVGFARHALPLRAVEGIMDRVAQVRREVQDPARRRWFELHYGREHTPRLRREKHEEVQRCAEELERYPYPPWESPEIRPSKSHCMHVLCCGHQQRDASLEYITLAKAERDDLRRMAYEKGLYLGDLIGEVLKREVEEWRNS